ncbi:MAG: dihydrofolate reductase family protein [Bacteroidota bacterium]
MRKLILFNMMTLDGFFEGPKHNIDWHVVDEEFNWFAIEQLDQVEAIVFGRVTYELMAGYWPTPQAIADDPEVAGRMNAIPKIVFSKTLKEARWNNTRLIPGEAAEKIIPLKEAPGRDLIIFGSADLASGLTREGLIDEYRIIVNPVILGGGTRLFSGARVPLKLLRTRVFASGNVLLVYEPHR